MGDLIKINMYADKKKRKNKVIDIENIKENLKAYEIWLIKNKRDDIMESYKLFLMQ